MSTLDERKDHKQETEAKVHRFTLQMQTKQS